MDQASSPTNPIYEIAKRCFFGNFPEHLRSSLLNTTTEPGTVTQHLLAFLSDVGEDPGSYGITDNDQATGVSQLCDEFIVQENGGERKAKMYSKEGCKVKFHYRTIEVHDCDAALGYIMSVQKLNPPIQPPASDPRRHHSRKIYTPLLILFCYMMKALCPGCDRMPRVACIVIGDDKIAIGSTIRGSNFKREAIYPKRNKAVTQLFPRAKAFSVIIDDAQGKQDLENAGCINLESVTGKLCRQDFGHCAETYPYLAFLEDNNHPSFAISIHGFAVASKAIVGNTPGPQMPMDSDFPLSFTGWKFWKDPCFNCRTILAWGYDCS